jgi:hypothetical protein
MVGSLSTALAWVESSSVAAAVRDSLPITAWLSAFHVIGVTLVGGGALVSALRYAGVLFEDQPVEAVTAPAGRAIGVGLLVSITTGALLFSARATAAAGNGTFQIKRALLLAGIMGIAARRRGGSAGASRAWAGLLQSALWGGVILAGCAFILLE